MEKKILDVTCGARGIWFDKHHPAAIYCDKRTEHFDGVFGTTPKKRNINIDPDVVCDFTDLPFDDNTFSLVVFDPPHVQGLKETSWIAKEYGVLSHDWREILKGGYKECMRVLKPDGVLIFKWSEVQIPASEVWKAIGERPLFGHHSGKKMNTFWAAFMKIEPKEDA